MLYWEIIFPASRKGVVKGGRTKTAPVKQAGAVFLLSGLASTRSILDIGYPEFDTAEFYVVCGTIAVSFHLIELDTKLVVVIVK